MQDKGSFTDLTTGAAVPAAVVQSLINHQLGEVQVGCRLRVVDTWLKPVAVLASNPVTGDRSDLSVFVDPATAVIQHDSTRAVHRSLHFDMLDPVLLKALGVTQIGFDPFKHFLQVSQILAAPQYPVSIEVKVGMFDMILPGISITPGKRTLSWDGLDLSFLIQQAGFISDYAVPQGYIGTQNNYQTQRVDGYLGAVLDLLQSDSIPISKGGRGITPDGNDDAGPAWPASLIKISSLAGNLAVPIDYKFPAGSSRLDAANALLAAINYYPLWLDEQGTLRIDPMPYYNDAIPPWSWDYSAAPNNTSNIVEPPVAQTLQRQSDPRLANIVLVQGSQLAQSGIDIRALSINTSTTSGISTRTMLGLGGRPRAITRYENNSRIATQVAAQARADLLLAQGASLSEEVQISTMHNPLHQDHEVLKFQLQTDDGTVVIPSSDQSPFLEVAWSLPLKAATGRQSHDLVRIAGL